MNLLKHKLRAFNYYARKKESKEPIWLEYLESDGNQYIDTGVKYTGDSTVDIVFSYSKIIPNVTSPIFGARGGDRYLVFRSASGVLYTNYGTGTPEGDTKIVIKEINKKYHILKDKGRTYVDNKLVVPEPEQNFTTVDNGYIFRVKSMLPTWSAINGRIYSYSHYINGKLIRNFRPCLNPNTLRPAMYDTVEKKYYYNNGTGEFKYDLTFVKLDYIKIKQRKCL